MFGKGGKQVAAGERARRGGVVSVIGADMVVTGDVAAADGLRVDGRVEGNVRCGALDLGEGGAIAGDIEADEARVAGRVDGRVTARTLVLDASARVAGDVAYESLAIAAGARVEGRLSHHAAPEALQAPAAAGSAAAERRGPSEPVAELFAQAAE